MTLGECVKAAIFNEYFPCNYSYYQENVPWRQVAQRHFETKRNIIKKRCVQSTLGTECEVSNPRGNINLRWQSVGGKYCLIVWRITDYSQSPSTQKNLATELWDLEARTIVQTYQFETVMLKLFGDYLLEINNDYEAFFGKLDPKNREMMQRLEHKIPLKDVTYETLTRNEDPTSSLIALHGFIDKCPQKQFVLILDLSTGQTILEKKYEYTSDQHLSVVKLYGDNLIMYFLSDTHQVIVLDVRQNKEISFIESYVSCFTMAGDYIWLGSTKKKCIIRYNLLTMKRDEFEFNDMPSSYTMKVFDGIIWLHKYPKAYLVDVSSNKCQILASISLPDAEPPQLTQLSSGKLVLTNENYAQILSFRDEDIESPISILQIAVTDEAKILRIKQGDLNNIILEHFNNGVTSEIVAQNPSNRVIMIYCYDIANDKGETRNPNITAYKMKKVKNKQQAGSAYHHQTSVIKLVHFDCTHTVKPIYGPLHELTAYGPCWFVYEQKVNGAWRRWNPGDDWWNSFVAKLASRK